MDPPAPTVIQGLQNLTANPDAIGAASDPAVEPQQIPGDSQGQEPAAQAKAQEPAETVEDLLKSNDELRKFIEAERSRAVNGYIQKRDAEVIQQKLSADRQQRDEAMAELARKAEAGDEEALKVLGKQAAVQTMQKVAMAEWARQMFSEADLGVKAILGDKPETNRFSMQNFQSIPEWLKAVSDAKTEELKAQYEARMAQEVERLAEAKATDLVSAQRKTLPIPDTTQPVAGGGTPRKWKTLSEASILLNNDEISLEEYAVAKQWFEERRIPFGDLV